jgi:hypothetical protein
MNAGPSCGVVLSLLALIATAGCAASGSDKARLLAPGQSTLSAGLDATITAPRLTGEPPKIPGLQLVSEYRHGLGDHELGLRTWGLGVEGLFAAGVACDVKVALAQKAADQRGWDFAWKGGFGYHQFNLGYYPIHSPFAELALLAGFNFNARHHTFFGLRIQPHLLMGQDVHTVDAWFSGLTVGHAWRVGRRLEMRPQLGLLYAPLSFSGTFDDPERRGAAITQLALAFAFNL